MIKATAITTISIHKNIQLLFKHQWKKMCAQGMGEKSYFLH